MSIPVVSVIIPVYNCEKFLAECISSVLDQSLTEIEIIIINDGSTDKSIDICKKYQKSDARIRLYSQKNLGVSTARNYGLLHATGDYIKFMDSDDELHPDALNQMYLAAKNHSAEVVEAGYFTYHITENIVWSKIQNQKSICLDLQHEDKIELIDYITKGSRQPYVWDKLYSRKHLVGSRANFSSGLGEDYRFNLLLMPSVQRYAVVNSKLYAYRIGQSSLSKSFNQREFKELNAVTASKIAALVKLNLKASHYKDAIRCWHWSNYKNILLKSLLYPNHDFKPHIVNDEIGHNIENIVLPKPYYISLVESVISKARHIQMSKPGESAIKSPNNFVI